MCREVVNSIRFSDSLLIVSFISLIFSPLGNVPRLPFAIRGCQFNLARFSDSLVLVISVSLIFSLLGNEPRLLSVKKG